MSMAMLCKATGHWLLAGILCSLATPLSRAADLTDPTRPPMTVHRSGPARVIESSIRVTAIFTTGDKRVAVVDGQVVKAGDRVGDISIHEITADGVRFSRGGRVEFARLPTQAATVRRQAAGAEEGP